MKKTKRKFVRLILTLAVWFVIVIYILPILWIFVTSFKTDAEAYSLPIKWINFNWTLSNYKAVFQKNSMFSNLTNSTIVALASSAISLLIGVPAAYALSRFRMKHKSGLQNWILSTRMAPAIVAALPYYILSRKIGLYDSKTLLVAMHVLIILSWVIWMMKSFFDDIPISIDESCMVDGCSRLRCLVQVMLPLSKTGIVATLIYALILSWNEYYFAFVLTGTKAQTMPASISQFLTVGGLMWGQMCAAGVVIMLPILIFVFFTQKHLVRGLTMGSVKE